MPLANGAKGGAAGAAFSHSVTRHPRGGVIGEVSGDELHLPGEGTNLPDVDELTERILYRLSLDTQVRALAERLLTKFRSVVGDLPASAEPPIRKLMGYTCTRLRLASRRWSSRATLL